MTDTDKPLPTRAEPLLIGTKLGHNLGTVEGVCLTGGERYYFCINRHGVVSFMPWQAVEPYVFDGAAGPEGEGTEDAR